MTGKEHINFSMYSTTLLGAGFGVGKLGVNLTKKDIFEFALGVVIGSLLPDVDHPKSILGRISPIPWLHKKFKKYLRWHFLKHGGITHTVLVNIGIFVGAYINRSMLGAGIAVGYFSHIYIDHVTGNKLPMLYWPFDNWR